MRKDILNAVNDLKEVKNMLNKTLLKKALN